MMAMTRKTTSVIASLFALALVVALLCASIPVLAQEDTDETAKESLVKLLTDQDFDISVASGGKWFVKFFAPWCGHCKELAPEWEKLAGKLNSDDVHIAKVDCTVSQEICTRFAIQGFPTLKLIEGESAIDYQGSRSIDDFEEFINKMSRPALIDLATEEDLTNFIESHATAFLFFGSSDSAENEIVEAAVKPFRVNNEFGRVSFAAAATDSKAAQLGVSPSSLLSPPAFIIRTPDTTFVYDGVWEAVPLSAWISARQFGLLPELGPQIFQPITKIGKPIVLIALLPQKQSDVTLRMQEIGREVARTFFDSFSFTWIDGEKWTQYLEVTYKVKQDDMPMVIVIDPKKNGYYTSKADNQDTFSSFLDSITSGVLEPTIFSRGQEGHNDEKEELAQFDRYRLLAEDFIGQYVWYVLLGVFLGGLLTGKVLFGKSGSPSPKKTEKKNKPVKKD